MTWTHEERTERFRNLERSVPTRTVKRGDRVSDLPRADVDLEVKYEHNGVTIDIEDYCVNNFVTGLLILHRGKIVAEQYRLGRSEHDRWTSWSVTKSITSTLLGAALQDGSIGSVADAVTSYVPELFGSAYDDVTLHQLLTMSSGVRWTEDYSHNDDFYRMSDQSIVDQMKQLARVVEPGSRFNYSTGDTNILGLVVARAAGMSLSDYLAEKIWQPCGMESDATWWLNGTDEVAGANLSMTLRDLARFGKFFMEGGRVAGRPVLSNTWLQDATTDYLPSDWTGAPGYGYQWWVRKPGKCFLGLGIFGQTLYVEMDKQLIVAMSKSWPEAGYERGYEDELPFLAAISDSLA
jgi:CubicO group peptidase (beta-lactamase class C family)